MTEHEHLVIQASVHLHSAKPESQQACYQEAEDGTEDPSKIQQRAVVMAVSTSVL